MHYPDDSQPLFLPTNVKCTEDALSKCITVCIKNCLLYQFDCSAGLELMIRKITLLLISLGTRPFVLADH